MHGLGLSFRIWKFAVFRSLFHTRCPESAVPVGVQRFCIFQPATAHQRKIGKGQNDVHADFRVRKQINGGVCFRSMREQPATQGQEL